MIIFKMISDDEAAYKYKILKKTNQKFHEFSQKSHESFT